ncbi:MAG: sigma-54 dependent transcriptional regulator [Bacillota bacterium]
MFKPEILVIDDEQEVCNFFQYLLEGEKGYAVTTAVSGKEARKRFGQKKFHLALVDLKLPDADGIALLREIKKEQPDCQVIIITGYSTLKSAVEAIRLEAFDYLEKPFSALEELEQTIEKALACHISELAPGRDDELAQLARQFGIILSAASPLWHTLAICRKIGPKNINVLIQGETGTGKELLARFLHFCSARAQKPFFAVNCGALTETLLESELFGHEKGAFTGATVLRRGIFEIADGGTLFLDEIGEASPAIQVKLLRVLETGEFMRVGGEGVHKTNTRILAATNKDLNRAAQEGSFREDLFYRLDVVTLHLPPLRERPDDIPLLLDYFAARHGGDREPKVRFSPLAMELLKAYHWPGNVRELANVVTRAVALSSGDVIGAELLPERITGLPAHLAESRLLDELDLPAMLRWWGDLLLLLLQDRLAFNLQELQQALRETETRILRRLIKARREKNGCGTDRDLAAALGVSVRTLRYLEHEK